jgi:hypothetical protein
MAEKYTIDLLAGGPVSEEPGSIFFVGTATTIIRNNGFTLLTDPNFIHAGDHAHLGYGLTSERLTNPAIDIDQLPHHTVWRMMGEDTYALAMEPSTNRDAGRWDAKSRGELRYLEPGETRPYDLEIGALDGHAAIERFEARVDALHPVTV